MTSSSSENRRRGKLDSKERSTDTWRQVGVNEAAMAVVVVNFSDLKNIEFLWSSPFVPFYMCSRVYCHMFSSFF